MSTEIDDELHRRLGIELFNATWDLLDRANRSLEENECMIHTAHASRYHWELVGTPLNLARGDWQISRVYAEVGRAEPALYHARRCLEICQQQGYGDFDLAYAYEALARASGAAGDAAGLAQYKALAQEAVQQIAEEDDRKLFLTDLATLP